MARHFPTTLVHGACWHRSLVACIVAALPTVAAGQPASLVTNGGFERGSAGWSLPGLSAEVVPSTRGGKCVQVTNGGVIQDVYVGQQDKVFTAAVDMKAANIDSQQGRGYGYAAVYQLDTRGEYVAFFDFAQATTEQEWRRHTYTFTVHPEARIISLRCGVFNATGTAWFDNWTLVEGDDAKRLDEVTEPAANAVGAGGVVGIFRQPGFPTKGTASSPETIAEILGEAGIETRFLDVERLSDATQLRPSNYDLIVLPYGESFPASARDSMTYYLHAGGDFVSLGGYAFNNLLLQEGDRWLPEREALERRLAEAMTKDNLLADGGFETAGTAAAEIGGRDVEARWHRSSETCELVADNPAEGRRCARVTVEPARAEGETKWDLRLSAKPNRRYRVSAQVRTQDVTGAGFAYVAMYRYDKDDELLKHTDFATVRGTTDWKRYEFDFTPEPGTEVLYLKCGLYRASGTAWFDDVRLVDISGMEPRPMNTATGTPADGLKVSPAQIGVFDADYRLKRVARVATAPNQTIFPEGIELGPAEGWAASGVRNYDHTRWVPLLAAYDRYGRSRGSAGSLMINYAGFYSGSAWAYFGVVNRDLFDGSIPKMRQALKRLVKFMIGGAYLRNLTTDHAAYAQGESVEVHVAVENRGASPLDGSVEVLAVRPGGESRTSRGPKQSLLCRQVVALSVEPGGAGTASASFVLPSGVAGLCRIVARLSVGGEVIDSTESGFVALTPSYAAALTKSAIANPQSSIALRFSDNYLRYGDRALFLFGCDNYSNVYNSATEGPLWWAREHAACRDFGFGIYENLQYSNPGHVMKEDDWRRFAGMAQLTQEHGLTFMPGMLVGHNVAVSDDEIAAEARQCGEYAARLKQTPKLLWYLNGDYQLRHDDTDTLKVKWNAFLAERYGTTEKLKAAWDPDPVSAEIGDLPFPPANSGRWDDVRRIDLMRFHVQLMKDWNHAHVAAIRSRDQKHPITSEYYSSPFNGIDQRLTIDGQEVSNIGFFDEPERDLDVLPLKIRWNDLRARGKSAGLGEYGVKTHPAWAADNGASGYHLVRTEEQQKQLFMAVAHYGFGMGCSRVQNWCLRDSDQRVFPWGVFYPGPLIPKDVAYVHRNLSLLFRLFEPVYEAPPLTVLICDNMRLGNAEGLGINSVYRCFEALLGLHVDFNVVSDHFADRLPETTKAIIWPAALCPGDKSYEAVLEWVRAGGTLLTTGGPVYDEDRRLTRTARLKQLAGVEWLAQRYAPHERHAQSPTEGRAVPIADLRATGAAVIRAEAGGSPLLTKHAVGEGTVCYFADPLELLATDDGGDLRALYRWFLEQAQVEPLAVTPNDPELHVLAQRTQTGRAYVAFGRGKGDSHRDATLATAAGQVTLRVKGRYPAIAAVNDAGTVSVLGALQSAQIEGDSVLSAGGMATVVALDGLDLRVSRATMVLPFSTGNVTLSRTNQWRRPVAVLGDIHGGKFRPLETLDLPPSRMITLGFDQDRSTLIALVCERGSETLWQTEISRWMSSPGEMPGR